MTDPSEVTKARIALVRLLTLHDHCERILDITERESGAEVDRALDDANEDLGCAVERLYGVVHALEPDDRLRRAALRVQGAYSVWMTIDTRTNPAFEAFVHAAGDEYQAAVRELREALADA